MFDIEIDVLLVERIEKELKKLRNKRESQNNRQDLSLYSNDINYVIDKVNELAVYNYDVDMITIFGKVLGLRMDNAESLLDIKADLTLAPGRYSYWFDELYSNEQLVKKLKEYLPYRIKQNKR